VKPEAFNNWLLRGELEPAFKCLQQAERNLSDALTTLAFARSHLTSAKAISSPAFGINPEDAQRIKTALDDVNHAIDQLKPQPAEKIIGQSGTDTATR
jgi:hypothetical protein